MVWVTMSERELNRVEIISQVAEAQLDVTQAADLLCMSRRQVFRLLKRYRQTGPSGLRHTARGRSPNNRIRSAKRQYILELIRDNYPDFGPTLAAEMLVAHHHIVISRETLRKWMIEDGLWLSRKQRRKHQSKLFKFRELRDAVVDRLKAGWSPEQIAGRLRFENGAFGICHETIYKYVYSNQDSEADLFRFLPEHRRKRRPRDVRRQRGVELPAMLAYKNRPSEVNERNQFGHWEGDLVMFRKEFGKANLTTLVERKTRYMAIFRNNDRQSKPIMHQVIEGLGALPRIARRSFTFDRGTEFASWRELKNGLGADVWFCDPYAPWQRGTNENTNRRLRRHLPRNTDPLSLTQKHLKLITELHNTTPRKCLGYKTPKEAFQDELLEAHR